MENLILKNQKQLYDNFPNLQIGSKFTKLTNRFASKTNYPINIKLPIKNANLSQCHPLKNPTQQNSFKQKKPRSRNQSTFEQSQLEYFKSLNSQIKSENFKLKQDLKICNQRLNQSIEQKKLMQQKLSICHKNINRSERKINNLMELAHKLILIVKDKLWDRNQDLKTNNNQNNINYSPFEQKKKQIQRQLDKIQQFTRQKRTKITKKSSMAQILDHKLQYQQPIQNAIASLSLQEYTDKSQIKNQKDKQSSLQSNQFSRRHNSKPNNLSINPKINICCQQKQLQIQQQQMNQIFTRVENFEKDVKQMKMLSHIMQGIAKTFSDESLMIQYNQHNDQNQQNKPAKNYVLQQIGTFFSKLMQRHQKQFHTNLKIQSKTCNQKINPTFQFFKIYASIKQIFDHQIYLLQNQKMLFLQYKNKRLLKFIYECSGCERYQQMFNEIFRIMREGFKQIKCKILPQFKNRNWQQYEGQFLI